jgi:hypothetical protein
MASVVWDDQPQQQPAPGPKVVWDDAPQQKVQWDDGMSVDTTAYGRIFDAGRAVVEDIFAEPLGISRENLGPLANQTPEQAHQPILGPLRAFNEVLIRGTTAAGDLALRGVTAVAQGGVAAATQTLKELGVSDTTANQFMRDANVALLTVQEFVPGAGRYPVSRVRTSRAKPEAPKAGERVEPVLEGAPKPANMPAKAETQLDLFDEAVDRAVAELPKEKQAAARAEVKAAINKATDEGESITGTGAIPPEGLSEPRIQPQMHKKVADAAEELLTVGGVRREPSMLISDQVMDLLQTGRLTTPEIEGILNRHGTNVMEFAELWRVDIKKAAQDLQRLSLIETRLRALAKETGAEEALIAAQDAAGLSGRGQGFFRRIDNMRRGLIVSQLTTAVRNFETQTGRVGIDMITNVVDRSLRKIIAPNSGEALAAPDAFGTVMRIFASPRKTAKQVEAVLSAHPTEQDRFMLQYMSDLYRGGGAGILGHAETAVDILNTANRFQEYIIRRAVLATSLERRLAAKGMSLDEIVGGGQIGKIDRADLHAAINDSLEATFAKDFSPFAKGPEGIAGRFIQAANAVPLVTTLPVPFARFMMNAVKYQFEYSPLGVLKLLSAEERAALAKGDTSAISKAAVGSAMFLAAYQLRKSEMAGERWYEVRLPSGTILDTRAFNPFASYLWWADVVLRANEDRLDTFTFKDVASGVLAANLRAGTGLFILDQMSEAMAGLPTNTNVVKDFAGTILAGFAVPLQQLKDVAAHFDKNEAIIRSAREGPYFGPVNVGELTRNIPYVGSDLPPAYSPLREGALRREFPLTRQLTGALLTGAKNPVEMEVDRLGMSRAEFYARTGDATADRMVTQIQGILTERLVAPFVQSPNYLRLGNRTRSYILSEILSSIRKIAREEAAKRNPIRFAKVKLEGLSDREKRMVDELTSGKFTEVIDKISDRAEK